MRLAKDLRIPDVEYIRNFDDMKDFLRDLTTELQKQHQAIYNDIRIKEAGYFRVNGVDWRVTVSGNNFVVQKLESGVWNTKWTFEPS